MTIKSQHGDFYNHDSQASRYDENVRNEEDPIRTGYDETLSWVAEQANIRPASLVLDLGSGTGNLSHRIPPCASLTCVDLSEKMTAIARQKLADRSQVEYVQADLMEYFAADSSQTGPPQFDAIISTYAVHHLTEDEKMRFFQHIWDHVRPDGRAVFGDLMLENQDVEEPLKEHFRQIGQAYVAEDIEEEFFWYVDTASKALTELGFQIEVKRFSTLSWGIAAHK